MNKIGEFMMEENNNKSPEKYTESSGTGVLSAIIFVIIAIILLFILSKYIV